MRSPPSHLVTVTVFQIQTEVDEIAGCWRFQTCAEQRIDLPYLDDLLGELDDLDPGSAGTTAKVVDELYDRIEILSEQIQVSLDRNPQPTRTHRSTSVVRSQMRPASIGGAGP